MKFNFEWNLSTRKFAWHLIKLDNNILRVTNCIRLKKFFVCVTNSEKLTSTTQKFFFNFYYFLYFKSWNSTSIIPHYFSSIMPNIIIYIFCIIIENMHDPDKCHLTREIRYANKYFFSLTKIGKCWANHCFALDYCSI